MLVDHGNATDISLDKLMDDVENRVVHPRCRQIRIGAQAQLADRSLEEDGVVLVVDGDELEDTILRDDRHYPFSPCLVVDIDQGDSSRAGLEHSGACIVE